MLRDWAVPGEEPPSTDAARDGRPFRAAIWDADRLSAIADRLAARGEEAIASVPIERRVAVWNEATAALLDPESDERRELFPALLATTRLSPEGLSDALDVVVGGAGAEAAEALVARAPHRLASGTDGVVLAANVPGLAVQSVLPALVVGRPLLLRSPAREPLFAAALVAALERREPALGEAFAAVCFPHQRDDLLAAALGGCRRVLAYGGASAIAALAARLGDRLIALGPKASIAFVAGECDTLAIGRALARDVALFDQRGCLSVQAVYVSGGAGELADALVFGLAIEHRRIPPGPVDPALAARVQQLRGAAALDGRLVGELPAAAGTVIVERETGFLPVPGLRMVRIHPVDSLSSAVAALEPWRDVLQGAALAGDEALGRGDEIAARLALARVAPAGRLQHAEAGWASGGVDPLSVFV